MTVTPLTYSSIGDGNFEAPALARTYGAPAKAYEVLSAPGGSAASTFSSPWVFSPGADGNGLAGVSTNNSDFTEGNPKAPSGAQVAFIQGDASISQTVYLTPGVYDLSMLAAQRIDGRGLTQGIEVLVGPTGGTQEPVGTIVPDAPVTSNKTTYTTSYTTYETGNFQIPPTSTFTTYSVTLVGTSTSAIALIDDVAITPAEDSLVDGGFETPTLDANTFQADPQDSAWTFSGTAGVARNGSNYTTNWVEAQDAPQGAQVAYIGNTNSQAGSMSQTVYLDPGTYQLGFLAAQRAIDQDHYEEINVVVDPNTPNAQTIGAIDPVNTLFRPYESSTFTITTAGAQTIEFVGVDPLGGDNTAFIDDVTLSTDAIANGSFEIPALSAGAVQSDPACQTDPGSTSWQPWQFTGTAGVDHNGAQLTINNPAAPDGKQVAYIEGEGAVSQSVTLIAGTYDISLMAAKLANGQPQDQVIDVQVGGVSYGSITPVGPYYHLYTSSNFTVPAGTYTIVLSGTQGSKDADLIDEVALTPANDEISDGGFQTPALNSCTYAVAPVGSSWQFSTNNGGSAGITTNGGAVAAGSSVAPEGNQAAYLTNQGGSFSQTVYLDPETYNISFMAAQRAGDKAQPEQIEVLIDPGQADQQIIGSITPAVTTAILTNTNTYYAYTLYQTSNFTELTAGPHTIDFLGMTPHSGAGQSTALIDEVSLRAVENTFSDGTFTSTVLPAENYTTPAANTSPWQFSATSAGSAGISNNQSSLTYNSGYAPAGSQVGYITGGGYISQQVYLDADTAGDTYSISFDATQHVGYQPQTIEVLLDPGQADQQVIATITPAAAVDATALTAATKYYYTSYTTPDFYEPTDGMHTIEFLGTTTGDCTAFIDDVTISSGCGVSDGNFQAVALTAGTYAVAPATTSSQPWAFANNGGSAGVSTNANNDKSSITKNNPPPPDGGDQVAFITDTGSISQTVYLVPGVYDLSFMAAQRRNQQTQAQTIQVTVAGTGVNQQVDVTPSAPGSGIWSAGTTFGAYATNSFAVTTAGSYTITFAGLSPTTASSTAFIDDVQLTA